MSYDAGALIAAVSGLVVSLIAALRGLSGDRFQRQVTQGAKVLESYTGLVDTLEERIEKMQADHTREIDGMRQRTAAERVEWEQERSLLRAEMSDMRQDRARLQTEVHELRALVDALISRDPANRTRKDDVRRDDPS